MADGVSKGADGGVELVKQGPISAHASPRNDASASTATFQQAQPQHYRPPWAYDPNLQHPGMLPSSSPLAPVHQQAQWAAQSHYWQHQQQHQQVSPGVARHPHPGAMPPGVYYPGVPPHVLAAGVPQYGYPQQGPPGVVPQQYRPPAHMLQPQQGLLPSQQQQQQQHMRALEQEWYAARTGISAVAPPPTAPPTSASTSTAQQQQQRQQQLTARPPLSSPATSSAGDYAGEESNDSSFQSPPLAGPIPSSALSAQQLATASAQTPTTSRLSQSQQQSTPKQSRKKKDSNKDSSSGGNNAKAKLGSPTPSAETRTGGLTQSQREVVDKLVGIVCETIPQHVMPERHQFFKQIVLLSEQNGDPLLAAPQVSKTSVDLHRIYCYVRNKGGFETVTREKLWKAVCQEANPLMQESSAAGYQLRRHYQKYLLPLECMETGKNIDELNELAEKMKKKKKEVAKEPTNHSSDTAEVAIAGAPSLPPQVVGQPPMFSPGSIPQHGQYPGGEMAASGAPSYYYAQQLQPPQQLQPSPGHPAWAVPGSHWHAGPYHPGIGARPAPPAMGRLLPPGSEQQLDPTAHARQLQQQHQFHFQQQLALGGVGSGEAPRGHLSSSTTPIPPASNATTVPGTAESRASSVGAAAHGGGGTDGALIPGEDMKGEGELRPASRRHATTPAMVAYTNATAPTPPLIVPTATAGSSFPQPHTSPQLTVMGQPPPVQGSSSQQFNQHSAPIVYAMRPASALQPPSAVQAQASMKSPHALPPQYSLGPAAPKGVGDYLPPSVYQAQHPGASSWQQQQQSQPRGPMGEEGSSMQARMQSPQIMSAVQRYELSKRYGAVPAAYAYQHTGMMGAGIPPTVHHPPSVSMGAASHSPGSQQRSRLAAHQQAVMSIAGRPPTQTMWPSQSGPGLPTTHPAGLPFLAPTPYPADSIEAKAISPLLLKKRRPKVLARELTSASPKRILMALRSGQVLESIWAINVLNVMLYDDSTAATFNRHHMPKLLNLIVARLMDLLAVLYPTSFKADSESDGTAGEIKSTAQEKNDNKEKIGEDASMPASLLDLPITSLKQSTGNRSPSKSRAPNYTKLSRLGRPVIEEAVDELPAAALQWLNSPSCYGVGNSSEANSLLPATGLTGSNTGKLLFNRWLGTENTDNNPLALLATVRLEERPASNNSSSAKVNQDQKLQPKNNVEVGDIAADMLMAPDFSLLPRATALRPRDEGVAELVERCLALSNILRGFSFIAGNERTLAQHPAILPLLAKLLKLGVDANSLPGEDGGRCKHESGEEVEAGERFNFIGLRANLSAAEKTTCAPEVEDIRNLLLETANHLRDDAFVILSHVSVQLELFDLNNEVAWNILDALLHWATSTSLQGKDPLQPGVISPRNYCLEILCKVSVIERNIDLLVSTGPWPRVERLVQVLCSLVNFGEELPYREFAIVILNAVCGSSAAACYVAAKNSSVLNHLVAFLESADIAMHQIVQHQSIQALRDNPELMGTSVGMLRRASSIMLHIARVESCRDCFAKLQNRLLQFTVSHFMDSRVAATVSEILYEMQRGEKAGPNNSGNIDPPSQSSAQQQQQQSPTRADSSLGLSSPVAGHEDEMSQMSVATTEAAINESGTLVGAPVKNGTDDVDSAGLPKGETAQPHGVHPAVNGVDDASHYDDKSRSKNGSATRKRRSGSPVEEMDEHQVDNGITDNNGNHRVEDDPRSAEPTAAKKPAYTTSSAVKAKLRNNLIQKHEEGNKLAAFHPPHGVENSPQPPPNGLLLYPSAGGEHKSLNGTMKASPSRRSSTTASKGSSASSVSSPNPSPVHAGE